MSKKTHIALVLDRSGSMFSIREQTVQGYNEQIRAFKEQAEEGSDIDVSLISFNEEVWEHMWQKPASEVPEAAQQDYVASGGTAMLDAIGHAIDRFKKTTDIDDENNAYLVVLISDGCENSSTHFTKEQLFENIDSLKQTKRWTFTFMGCEEQYVRGVSESLGIPLANCAVWDHAHAQQAYGGHAKRMRSAVRSVATAGFCNSVHSDDLSKMADYTTCCDNTTVDKNPAVDDSAEVHSESIFSKGKSVWS